MRPLTCDTCGCATTAVYRLCGPCLTARVDADCEAQGIPRKLSDPADVAYLSRVFARGVA